MRRAVCSGSFDPVTNGHVDIFYRASLMFDEVIVGVFHNVRKKPFFSVEERLSLIEEATGHIQNIRVMAFEGLLADCLLKVGARYNVRGLRSFTDFEYEKGQADILHHISKELETVFLLTKPEYAFISSSGIREMAIFGADCSMLVPSCVYEAIKHHLNRKNISS